MTCGMPCPREHLRMDYLPNGCTAPDGHDGPHACSNPDSHSWTRGGAA